MRSTAMSGRTSPNLNGAWLFLTQRLLRRGHDAAQLLVFSDRVS